MPMTTPVSLYMSRRGSSITRSQRRTLFSTPFAWSSTIHAYVRTRMLVHSGSSTNTMSTRNHAGPTRVITYATG